MLLGRDDVTGEPEQPYSVQKRVNHPGDGFFETHVEDDVVEYPVEHVLVKVDGGFRQLVDEYLVGVTAPAQGEGQLASFLVIHPGNGGYLMSVVIEKGDAEQAFQVIVVVNTVVACLAFGAEQLVTLLPDTQGMGLYAAETFDIPYGKSVHRVKTKGFFGNSSLQDQDGPCNISVSPTTYNLGYTNYYYKFARNHQKTKECRLISCWY